MAQSVMLVFQGGGSLGAFQCGVYRALAPWLAANDGRIEVVAGASIGALNAGVVAAHMHEADGGVGALERFWRDLSAPPYPFLPLPGSYWQRWNGLLTGLLFGNLRLFAPNPLAWHPLAAALRFELPFHDTDPMRRTLAEHVGDYGPNPKARPLLLVRATDVETGEAAVFHSWRQAVTPEHLRASAGLPLVFPAPEIDGRRYWDGELAGGTVLPEALAVLWASGTDLGALVVVLVGTSPRASARPLTALQASYRAESIALGGKADGDALLCEASNRHVEFVRRAHRLAAGLGRPGSSGCSMPNTRRSRRKAGGGWS